MNAQENVRMLWATSNSYWEPGMRMDLETAAADIEEFKRANRDLILDGAEIDEFPDDLTPETYMEIYNEFAERAEKGLPI